MTNIKLLIGVLVVLTGTACTSFYSGDGEYIVDRHFLFESYSIEFPEVPLDREGVHVYQFDNYYTANRAKRLEFDIAGDGLVPTILSTHIKFEVFDKEGTLVAFMSGPLNGREMAFLEKPFVYPIMSWMGGCSKYYNSFDHEARQLIAKNPTDKQLVDDYVRRFPITECTFVPDHSPESPFHKEGDGGTIKSFHKYKVVLTVSQPNAACANIRGRISLRSGWK